MDIEPIAAHHDTKSFNSGEPEMDDFLRSGAFSGQGGQTWVVVPEIGAEQVIAFYTINPDPITGVGANEYGEHPVGFVTLEALGVDRRYQGQGIGRRLLFRMIKQILMAANQQSINGLLLTALHDEVKTGTRVGT